MESDDSNGPHIRRFFCVLLAVTLLASAAFTASAATTYDLSVSNSVDGPAQEFTVEGQVHHVSSLSYYEPGEFIEASVTKPGDDGSEYELLLYNSEKQIEKNTRPQSTSGDFTFTTDELSAGTYVLVVEEDDFEAVHPIVIQGYDVSVDTQSTVATGESWTATADLTAYEDAPAVHSVEFVLLGEDTEQHFQGSKIESASYKATVTAPENAGEYSFGVIVRGTTEVGNGEHEPIAVSQPVTVDVQSGRTDEGDADQGTGDSDEENATATPVNGTQTPTPDDDAGTLTPAEPQSTDASTATPTLTPYFDGPMTPTAPTVTADQSVSEEAGIDEQPGFGVGIALAALFTTLALLARRQ